MQRQEPSMAEEEQPDGVRLSVVVRGALLIFASVPVAFGASQLFYTIRPAQVWGDRTTVLIPFLPLTALTILVAGIAWTRRSRPSLQEMLLALLPLEFVVSAIILLAYRPIALDTIFLWALANALFVPWWLLGAWAARVITRSRRE
jgi:hypothetical protein